MFFDVTEDEIKTAERYAFSTDKKKAFAHFLFGGIQCYMLQTKGRFAGKYISYGSTYNNEDAIRWINNEDVELLC